MSPRELRRDDDTFPKLLARNARQHPERTALREKEFGIWQPVTWAQYHDAVRELALGFHALGMKRGDKVAIVGGNRPEWVMSELAAQALGGASVGVYQDSTLTEVAYVIDHCDAEIVVAEDQEQVDKILDMMDRLPKVRAVVYTDPRGLRAYRHPALVSFEAVRERGREVLAHRPELFDEEVAKGRGEDLAIVSYTSGTTGFPKGAMLSFRNLLSMARALHEVDPKRPDDEFVSFLPLAWIGEQMMCLSSALAIGFTVNFPEEPETVMENVREIGPHVMFAPPRVWENMVSSVQVRIMDTTPFKRFMYERMMPIGYRVADLRFAGKPVPPLWRFLHWLGHVLLFRALKDRLGLSRLRTASTGGAALGPDVFRFFHGMGVPLKQIYGQTEIAGISCIHREGQIRFHTVGEAIPGTEVRISDAGEILSRSPSVFMGYYKNEAATREAVDGEGWLHSGDAGHLDEGQLVVIDRLKDVMRLADGTQFSPQFIENRLKFSPYVKEAVVVGKDRPYLAALLCIDMGIVGKWAEKQKIGYTTYTDLSSRPQVYDLVEKEVAKVNETLPAAARVQKFVLLYKELDADDDELTRTRKVKRNVVEQRYGDVIAAVYGEREAVDIDATIKFQDGKTAHVQARLPVRRLQTGSEPPRKVA
ncbi:MAG TPA: long-chain fatty acid--CoA ligase [Anaeromyxobacteraceae bacterium]|nr:long-chain fatty acid--CoA ligase [Anaeromyxobacteraceae bacterium]